MFALQKLNPILIGIYFIILPFVYEFSDSYNDRQEALYVTVIFFSLVAIINLIMTICKKRRELRRVAVADMIGGVLVLYLVANIILVSNCNVDISVIFTLLLLITVYAISRNIANRKIIIYSVVVSGLVQSSIAILQSLSVIASNHSAFLVTGSLGNPGQLGGYLAVGFICAIGLLISCVKNKNGRGVTLFAIVNLVILIGLLLADSRAAIVGVVGGLCVFIYDLANKFIRKHYIISTFALIVGAVVLFIALFNYRPASANSRILIWKVASGMIQEKPVAGHGLLAFDHNYMSYQADFFAENPDSEYYIVADNTVYPFNESLLVWVETGLIGLLLILAFVISILLRKSSGTSNLVLKASIVAYVLFAQFSYPSDILPILIIFPMITGLVKGKPLFQFRIRRSFLFLLIFFCAIAISASVVSLKKNFERSYILNMMAMRANQFEIEDYIDHNFNSLKNNRFFASNYPIWLIDNNNYDTTRLAEIYPTCETYYDIADIYKHLGQYDKAEMYYRKSSNMIPSRFMPEYKLWELYCIKGDTLMAVKTAEHLLAKPFKIESTVTLRSKGELKNFLSEHKNN